MKTLNLEQAATMLNLHANTLQERAAAGQIPGAKIGRAWIFHEEILDQYLRDEIERQVKERRGASNDDGHGESARSQFISRVRPKRNKPALPMLPDA